MPLRKLVGRGLKIGLGTDVSGGYSPSMLNAMRSAITVSSSYYMDTDRNAKPLHHSEAFYLATQGGADLLGIGDTIGSFAVGKQFDALVIDPNARDSPFDTFAWDTPDSVFEKFCYLGDDRNIVQIYVQGRRISL